MQPYRVSTMTCNGKVGAPCVDLLKFYTNLRLQDGFVWTDYKGSLPRGTNPKKLSPTRKVFDNQVTVIFKAETDAGTVFYPNVKLFRNGSMTITGVRKPADGEKIIEAMALEIRRIATEDDAEIVSSVESVVGGDFSISMINSDFVKPFEIRRKELHKLLISNDYGNQCIFQPGLYPGVKLQYFYNTEATEKDGICKCSEHCIGKGKGTGDKQCKKVTVCIFESGKILITGGNSYAQIDEAYAFINGVFADNLNALRKPPAAA